MSARTCKVCSERRAVYCARCGPHQTPEGVTKRIEAKPLRAAERSLGTALKVVSQSLPEGWGCVLIAAQFGQGGALTYASDIDREAMPTLLREMANVLERREDRPPGALGSEN